MIYAFPPLDDPVCQGDIFANIPRIDVPPLEHMSVIVNGTHAEERAWEDIASSQDPVMTVLAARPVTAIVASQNCDAQWAPEITLCEIREFADVEGKAKTANSPKAWSRILTQHARVNQKWFYLPPDHQVGFGRKMAVDFLVPLRVARADLENLRGLRKGRLNPEARAHFRERIAEFFRRFPYDEWYALDREELKVYRQNHPDAEPRPWQSS